MLTHYQVINLVASVKLHVNRIFNWKFSAITYLNENRLERNQKQNKCNKKKSEGILFLYYIPLIQSLCNCAPIKHIRQSRNLPPDNSFHNPLILRHSIFSVSSRSKL
jgi:hypothetical protein